MKKLLLVVVLLIAAIATVPAAAQDAIPFNEIVVGEITDDAYAVSYTFEGAEGDIVIIDMGAVDILADLSEVVIELYDSAGTLIATTDDGFALSTARLAVQLEAADTYTVTATRAEGEAGTSVGEFYLRVALPEALSTAVSATISSEELPHYYLVDTTSSFGVFYTKSAGDFSPQMSIATLDDDSPDLAELAGLYGDSVTTGLLGNFEPDMPYIVVMTRALFSFSFGETTADYTLEIIQGD